MKREQIVITRDSSIRKGLRMATFAGRMRLVLQPTAELAVTGRGLPSAEIHIRHKEHCHNTTIQFSIQGLRVRLLS